MKSKLGIAAIIDDESVAINIGSSDNMNINIGDEINVLSSKYIDIIDPFTNEKLGKIYHIKAVLVISHIEKKYSICKSKDPYIEKYKGLYNSNYINKRLGINTKNIFDNNKNKTKLRVDSNYINRDLTSEPIKIGDSIELNVVK